MSGIEDGCSSASRTRVGTGQRPTSLKGWCRCKAAVVALACLAAPRRGRTLRTPQAKCPAGTRHARYDCSLNHTEDSSLPSGMQILPPQPIASERGGEMALGRMGRSINLRTADAVRSTSDGAVGWQCAWGGASIM